MVTAYFLARKYEPEVRDLLVRELNKKLAVPVQVGDINLSLLRRFPDATLRFSDVVIPETSGTEGDTLLYVKNLYLRIGLIDFLRKNYKVSEAEVNTGFYRMKFYSDGTDNFRFWKTEETAETETSDESHIELNNIKLVNFDYRLQTAEGLELDMLVRRAMARGDFGKEIYAIDTRTDIAVKRVEYKDEILYRDIDLVGPIKVNIDVVKSRYDFEGEGMKLAGQTMKIMGYMDDSGKVGLWHVEFATEGADVERLVRLIPADLRSEFAEYSATGRTNMNLVINSGEDFELDAAFDDMHGSFRHMVAMGRAKVKEGAGSIRIRNGKTSLYIDRLDGEIGVGSVSARGKIVDFSAPTFDLHLKGDIDLSALKDLINISRAEVLDGRVKLDGHLTGHLARGHGDDDKLKLLRGIDFSGSMRVIDGGFKAEGRSERLDNINGDIELRNNAIAVKNAGGTINGNPFEIEGSIGNALPYLSESGQKLHIAADFRAPRLDLNELWNQEEASRDTSYHFTLPHDVSFNLIVAVDEIDFRKFSARKVTGKAYYKNGVFSLNPVSFELASGKVNASLIISAEGREFRAQATASALHLDIDRVFTAFENFGQSVIKAENISGIADLDIVFNADFGSDLNIDLGTVKAQADLSVVNGKLKNIQSLQQIADFVRSNGLWNALIRVDALEKNLQVVSFDDLKNSIVIANRTVTIPEMKLGNSALTLDVLGKHGFDNSIDYSLSFRLSELLQTGRKKDEQFGYVADDGTGLRLFMRMYGTTEAPEFAIDKDAARDNRRDNLQTEKTELKNILKSEFGLFKSDSTLTGVKEQPKTKTTKFDVEWDGGGGSQESKDSGTEKKEAKAKSDKSKNPKKPTLSDKDRKLYEELEGDDDL